MIASKSTLLGGSGDEDVKHGYVELLASADESSQVVAADDQQLCQKFSGYNAAHILRNPRELAVLHWDEVQLPNALACNAFGFYLSRLLLMHPLPESATKSHCKALNLAMLKQSLAPVPSEDSVTLAAFDSFADLVPAMEPSFCAQFVKAVLNFLDSVTLYRLSSTDSHAKNPLYTELLRLRRKCAAGDYENRKVCPLFDSCLIGLAVAFGSQELLLVTSAELLSPLFIGQPGQEPCVNEMITLPRSYLELERCVFEKMFGTYDWISSGIHDDLVTLFVDLPETGAETDDCSLVSFAVDVRYIYVLRPTSLYKIGSGFGGSVAGRLYQWKILPSDSWRKVICCGSFLYLESTTRIFKVNPETFDIEGDVAVDPLLLSGRSHLSSNGVSLRLVYSNEESELRVSELDECLNIVEDEAYGFEKKFVSFGSRNDLNDIIAEDKFKIESSDVAKIWGSDRQIFLLTKQAKVVYTFQDEDNPDAAEATWRFIPLTSRFKGLASNSQSTCVLLITEDGDCLMMGSLIDEINEHIPFEVDMLKVKNCIFCTGLKGQVRICACSDDTIFIITADDHIYVINRNKSKVFSKLSSALNCKVDELEEAFVCDSQVLIKTKDGRLLSSNLSSLSPTTSVSSKVSSSNVQGDDLVAPSSFCPFDITVEYVCCGLSHAVIVTNSKLLATTGKNGFGQLGIGSRSEVVGLQFPIFDSSLTVKAAAAGYNHTAILMSNGSVYTFGDFEAGQLGRPEGTDLWNTIPGTVELPENVQDFVVRKVFAFANSTVLMVEQRCVPLSDAEVDVDVSCTGTGCFVFFSKQNVKSNLYLVTNNFSRTADLREERPVASALSHLSCFDVYNALWRFDAVKRKFVCFLPYSGRCEYGFRNTSFVYDDPVTYVPYLTDRAFPLSIGLNILRTVSSLSENLEFLSKQQGERKGRDSCFDSCYRIVRCKAILPVCQWSCDEGRSDETLEFRTDRDVVVFGLGLFGGEYDEYTATVTIGCATSSESFDEPHEVLKLTYKCLDGDSFDVVLKKPMLCNKDVWYRLSAVFSPTNGNGCNESENKVVGEDGTTFFFRNAREEYSSHSYLKSYQFPKLIYLPAYLFDGDTFDSRRYIYSPLWNADQRLLRNMSLPTIYSVESIVKLLKQASQSILAKKTAKSSGPFDDYVDEMLCDVITLCLNMLESFFNHGKDEGGFAGSDSAGCVPEVLDVITKFYEVAKHDNVQLESRFSKLRLKFAKLLQDFFDVFFSPEWVMRLLNKCVREENWQSEEMLTFLTGFARTRNPFKMVYGVSIADQILDAPSLSNCCYVDEKLVQPSALFRFASKLTQRIFKGDLVEAFGDAAVDFIYRVLSETASHTSYTKNETSERLSSVCRFKSPKNEDWHCGSAQPDAIQFKVDRSVLLHGFAIYVKKIMYEYNAQLRHCPRNNEMNPSVIATAAGSFNGSDCGNGTFKVLFFQPILLKPFTEYVLIVTVIALSCYGGSSGLVVCEGTDRCKFTFSQSCYSRNGTGVERGLIPVIYYTLPDTPSILQWQSLEMRFQFWQWVEQFVDLLHAVVDSASSNQFSKHFLRLCSKVIPLISIFIHADLIEMKRIVRTFGSLLLSLSRRNGAHAEGWSKRQESTTTMARTVESRHPYFGAGVEKFSVELPESSAFIVVEFDEACRTRQEQDVLEISVLSQCGQRISVGPFSGKDFPKYALLLPGNRAEFTFATATPAENRDEQVDEKAMFGFKCYLRAISFADEDDVLHWLEKEVTFVLSYAGSAFFWYANDLQPQLYPESRIEEPNDSNAAEPQTNEFHIPLKDITETGFMIPPDLGFDEVFRGNDFLKESKSNVTSVMPFSMNCVDRTSVELCRWLIEKPFIDPLRCKFFINAASNKKNQLLVHLVLIDQYGNKVFLSELDVRVVTVLVNSALNIYDLRDPHVSFGECLKSYKPTFKHRLRFQTLGVQPEFENLSFEEIRLQLYGDGRRTFMLRLQTGNGNLYSSLWNPFCSGSYRLFCFIDGVEFPLDWFVEVDSSRTVIRKTLYDQESFDTRRMAVCIISPPLHSVAVRSSPSFKSDVIGHVPSSDFFSFSETVTNDYGCWIKLPPDSAAHFCESSYAGIEGWCLHYDAASQTTSFMTMPFPSFDTVLQRCKSYALDCTEEYCMLNTEVAVRREPRLEAPVIGYVGHVRCCQWLFNDNGVWVKLDFYENDVRRLAVGSNDLCGYCCVIDPSFRRYLRTSTPIPCDSRQAHDNDTRYVLQPSSISSAAIAFAAFIHRRNISDDFTSCLLYMKFHPHLWLQPQALSNAAPSIALTLFRKIFEKICVEITTVSQGKMFLGSNIKVQQNKRRFGVFSDAMGYDCELCDQMYLYSLSDHLKMAHPGCMVLTCNGYDSKGNYQDCCRGDESENCGIEMDDCYMLCTDCRKKYLLAKESSAKKDAVTALEFDLFPNRKVYSAVRFISHVLLATDNSERGKGPVQDANVSTVRRCPAMDINLDNEVGDDLSAVLCHKCYTSSSSASSNKFLSSATFSCPSNCLTSVANDSVTSVSEFMKVVLNSCLYFGELNSLLEHLRISAYRAVLYECGYKLFIWLLTTSSYEEVVLSQLNFLLMEVKSEPWRKLLKPGQFEFLSCAVKDRLVALQSQLLDAVVSLMCSSSSQNVWRLCGQFIFSDLFSSDPALLLKKGVVKSALSHMVSDVEANESQRCTGGSGHWEVVESQKLSKHLHASVSSQKSLEAFLLDGQTDTFWESDKADLTSWKQIYAHWGAFPQFDLELCLYVDNKQDNETHVSTVAVLVEEGKSVFRVLASRKLKPSFTGWIRTCVTDRSDARIKLYGEHFTLRVRQLYLIGIRRRLGSSDIVNKTSTNISMLHKDMLWWCEAFCDRLVENKDEAQIPADMRKKVMDDIVCLLDEKVEKQQLKPVVHDDHFIDLIRITMKLMASSCRDSLTETTKKVLLSMSLLLLVGGDALQKSALEMMTQCIDVCNTVSWGLVEFSQNLLKAFAKVLTVRCTTQPDKTFTVANSLINPTGWYVDRKLEHKLASQLSAFIMHLKCGDHGSNFARTVKGVLINSTKMWFLRAFVEHMSLKVAIQKPEFWLSLASLFHLSPDDSLKEHSQDDATDRTSGDDVLEPGVEVFCENHDDSHTLAEVFCLNCRMYFCGNCCTVLHLNASKRNHECQQLKIGKNQLVVRNTYVRLKVRNLVLVIDKNNYNVVLNFRTADAVLGSPVSGCSTPEWKFCHKPLSCGHLCTGVEGEAVCLPCLSCASVSSVDQDEDDVCMICFWERLSAAPSIRLSCGHVFHYHCCQNSLKNKWYGPRISFNFMTCPLCRKTIDHQLLKSLLTPFTALQAEIQEKALMRLDYEGMRNCPEITDPHSRFYNDATAFAMEKYAYFQCYKCQKSYFGGTAECQAAQASSDYDPTELVCGGCSNLAAATVCPKHGAEYLQYKCRYCCSIAVFFCFGTTHFCARCHDHYGELAEAQLSKLPQCPTGSMGQRLPSCPLKVVHPPSGIEFPLGCSLCTYTKDF